MKIFKRTIISLKILNITLKIGNFLNIMYPKNIDSNSDSIAQTVSGNKSSYTIDKISDDKLSSTINKEVNKILGSALERTSSGCDLKVTTPLRQKREYRSQEVLPIDEQIISGTNFNEVNILPSQSEIQINDFHKIKESKSPRVSILHDNQRAEIVASVTERLYSKLKKKEESAISKAESIVDKKVKEPLNELKICSNARQRLIELSQKAIRNRRKISVNAYTQTRASIIRVKDQSVDVQSDLESYSIKNYNFFTCKRDVSTETLQLTARCKEMSVGPTYGSLRFIDNSTLTDLNMPSYKNSCMMTETTAKNTLTQTDILPPPRRKKHGSKNSLRPNFGHNSSTKLSSSPVISINISQTYHIESDSQSSEDNLTQYTKKKYTCNDVTSPNLSGNHENKKNNEADNFSSHIQKSKNSAITSSTNQNMHAELKHDSKDFSDDEDCSMPRVLPDLLKKGKKSDIKDLILGRNKNLYPYNIQISPIKEKDNSKRVVTFTDLKPTKKNINRNNENDIIKRVGNCFTPEETISEDYVPNDIIFYDSMSSIDSIRLDSVETNFFNDEFLHNKSLVYTKKHNAPVYENNPRHKASNVNQDYKELLEFEKNISAQNIIFHRNDQISNKFVLSDMEDQNDALESNSKHRTGNEPVLRSKNFQRDNEFERIQQNILDACKNLESSLKNYNTYVASRTDKLYEDDIVLNTPSKYLQHLIRLRREVVKMERVCNMSLADTQR